MKKTEIKDNVQIDSDVVLKADHLSIHFGGLRAVDDVNLTIKKGELYGLIGPNGAGKTTMFNLLTGVYKPTFGRFYLCGKDLTGKAPREINRAGIARTFQNIRLFGNLTVLENVMVGLGNQINCSLFESVVRLPRHFKAEAEYKRRAMELLEVFGLSEFADYLACNLPYGKQRKLEIARAMATNPTLLLLDEPAAGMNPNETQELMNDITFIREKFGITILLIEHDMKLVSGICEKLTVLNFGTELAQGETSEVLNNPEVIKAYIGE
ncbi:MAG: ABC transporter ATP-binding protein [Clostridia bacterium]|nr:ABC transporter ATP-binding protein [Clostridia bacterium]